jgi:hypothetical protein
MQTRYALDGWALTLIYGSEADWDAFGNVHGQVIQDLLETDRSVSPSVDSVWAERAETTDEYWILSVAGEESGDRRGMLVRRTFPRSRRDCRPGR